MEPRKAPTRMPARVAPELPPVEPEVLIESRTERLTVRLTPTEALTFTRAARARGLEPSRYFRDCAVMGHSIKAAQAVLKTTGAGR